MLYSEIKQVIIISCKVLLAVEITPIFDERKLYMINFHNLDEILRRIYRLILCEALAKVF